MEINYISKTNSNSKQQKNQIKTKKTNISSKQHQLMRDVPNLPLWRLIISLTQIQIKNKKQNENKFKLKTETK